VKKEQIQEILRKHKLWLDKDPAGERANLHGADLHGANLWSANLRWANLQGANLQEANLEGANLQGANLQGADLHGAYLQGADLHGANLQEADLHRANLWGANLKGADLHRANLEGANLQGAYLYGTKILSFQGDQHFAYCHEDRIRIGCVDRPIKYWVEYYKEIGLDQGYTEQDIEEYGAFIETCKRRQT